MSDRRRIVRRKQASCCGASAGQPLRCEADRLGGVLWCANQTKHAWPRAPPTPSEAARPGRHHRLSRDRNSCVKSGSGRAGGTTCPGNPVSSRARTNRNCPRKRVNSTAKKRARCCASSDARNCASKASSAFNALPNGVLSGRTPPPRYEVLYRSRSAPAIVRRCRRGRSVTRRRHRVQILGDALLQLLLPVREIVERVLEQQSDGGPNVVARQSR